MAHMQDGSESMEQEDDIDEIRALRMGCNDLPDEDVSYEVIETDGSKSHDNLLDDSMENDTSTLALNAELSENTNNQLQLIEPDSSDATNLHAALLINRDYQALLHAQLRNIQAELEKNKELQKKYRAILDKSNKPQRRAAPTTNIGKRAPGIPYFTDQDGRKPPDNADTVELKPELEKTALAFRFRKWSRAELNQLGSCIRKQNSEALFSRLVDDLSAYRITTDQFTAEQARIRALPPEEFVANVDNIVWEDIATSIGPTRTAEECKITWLNSESPQINKAPWTKEEDNNLVKLAKQHRGHRWETIAKELGTGRVAVQCFRRYQRNLNTNIVKTAWDPREDQILTDAVKKYGEKNWQQVANCLEGRTGQQCLHRWDKTLKPNIKRGRWGIDEDKMLLEAVEKVGEPRSWIKISKLVPGRTDMQCRERWVNILNPELNHNQWTPEEDERLKQGIAAHGLGVWTKVAQFVKTRTDNQCWRRWKSVHPTNVDEYREAIGAKKAPSRRKLKQTDPVPTQGEDNVEVELKRVVKRRKLDVKNARKGNKALNDGIQSALEPDEPIRVFSNDTAGNEANPPVKRGRGRPPKNSRIEVPPAPTFIVPTPRSPPPPHSATSHAPVPISSIPTTSTQSVEQQILQRHADNQRIQQQLILQQQQLMMRMPLSPAEQPTPAPAPTPAVAPATVPSTPTLTLPITPVSTPIQVPTPTQIVNIPILVPTPVEVSAPIQVSAPVNDIPIPISSRRKPRSKPVAPPPTPPVRPSRFILNEADSDEEMEDSDDDANYEDSSDNSDDELEDDEDENEGEDGVDGNSRRERRRRRQSRESALPALSASPLTFVALYRLFQSLAICSQNSKQSLTPTTTTTPAITTAAITTAAITTTETKTNDTTTNSPLSLPQNDEAFVAIEPYVHTPEFKLLAAWFNSIFLSPLLVVDECQQAEKAEQEEDQEEHIEQED